MLTCSSSWLIAAYRVLLRFETPRHPPYALLNLTYVSSFRYFRFILICLGKSILLLSTDSSVEDLSEENVVYMSSLRFPCFRFSCFFCAVFSEQRSTSSNQLRPSGLLLGTFSHPTCYPLIFALRLDSRTGQERGHTKIHSRVLDAPSKLDNAKR